MYQINDRVRMVDQQDGEMTDGPATIVWSGPDTDPDTGMMTVQHLLHFDESEEWMHDGGGRGENGQEHHYWYVFESKIMPLGPLAPEPEVEPWWLT